MDGITSFIDGTFIRRREGPGEEVRSPSDRSDVVGTWYEAEADDVGRALASAKSAYLGWKGMSAQARGQILFKMADAIEAEGEALARLGSREMGKPIVEMRGEVARAVALFRYYAGEGARALGEVYPSQNPDALLYTERRPLGPVLLITPWNFPVAIPVWKLAPALVFGNPVVWKPAENAVITAAMLAEILSGAGLPPGVLQVVLGHGSTVGPLLLASPEVKAVSFTGSREVGRGVGRAAFEIGARFQLEMGGKNPAIVFEDADLDLASRLITSGALRSAGQKCTATSRVIVVREIFEKMRDRLADEMAAVRQGPALQEDIYLGPVVSARQKAQIMAKIERGAAEGGRLLLGPEPQADLPEGSYVAPTLLEQRDPSGVLQEEEIFGPVVALFPAPSTEAAIEMANGVPYGLSASLFTRDLDRCLNYVKRIESGLIRVNEESAGVEYQAPFGGVKDSSYGPREQGRAAMDFYTETRTITIRPSH